MSYHSHIRILIAVLLALMISAAPVLMAGDAPISPEDYSSCGKTTLYTICKLHGINVTWDQIGRLFGESDRKSTHNFEELASVARQTGLFPIALQCQRSDLKSLPLPAIVHANSESVSGHFQLLLGTTETGVWLLDPPRAHELVAWDKFSKRWTGKVLV